MPYLAQTEGLIRSIYPPAPAVCGVKLHPLTLGHLAQMEALGVYDQLEKFETVGGGFVLGIFVCSNTFEKSLEIVNAGELEAECDKVQETISKHDVEQGIKDFKEYLRDSQDLPDTWSKSKGSSDFGGDWRTSLKLSIQSELHVSENDVWNMYLTQIIFEHYSLMERKGALSFVTPAQRHQQEEVKAMESEIMEHVRRLGLCQ